MGAHLIGLGTARPPHLLAQSDAADLAVAHCGGGTRERVLRALYRRTAIESRGCALLEHDDDRDGSGETAIERFYRPAAEGRAPTTGERMQAFDRLAPALALPACRAALHDAGVAPGAITHVVVATCTGFAAPGLDATLVAELGLSPSVSRVQVGFMGCHAALNALQVADAFVRADASARVLVCCAELCSLHLQSPSRPDGLVANALFGDGAAAAVLGTPDAAGRRAWRIAATASRIIGDTSAEMGWHIGDHGFVMTLSPHVPALVSAHLRPWLDEWLAEHGLGVEDVGAWAIHAGGPRIVQAVQERLGLDADDVTESRRILQERGNMSSATILFILERLREGGAALPCVALAFGPGLVAEAALFAQESPP